MLSREKSRLVKRSYDLLVWIDPPDEPLVRSAINLSVFLEYIRQNHSGVFTIQLFVPEHFIAVQEAFKCIGLMFQTVNVVGSNETISASHPDIVAHGSEAAFATAINIGADCLLLSQSDPALAFAPEADYGFRLAVTEPTFLLTLVRTFSSGFDVPWSFSQPIVNLPWSSFYQISERELFLPLFDFEELLQQQRYDSEVRESARSLIHNRLPQVAFSRDRLIWLSMQRDAARRDGFKSQTFQLETSFYLNSYYLLISGAFDHVALLVNAVCKLNLKAKQVGATYEKFLKKLQLSNPELHAIFTEERTTAFLERLNALRHLAAHRGSITPTTVYKQPEREPSEDEIRAHILRSGNGWMVDENTGWISETRHFLTKIEMMEVLLEDAVIIEMKDGQGFVNPLADTPGNFAQMRHFINRAANFLCTQLHLQSSSS